MSEGMANPERLIAALDERLDHEVRLILYGRSAIWLGFENPPPQTAATQDVDSIIPEIEIQALSNDLQFWDARDAVNEHFKRDGLYITHLFSETEVFLRRDWLRQITPISKMRPQHLRLFRPATVDLVLTKMMRGDDEQDMDDAAFMIRQDRITENQMLRAFSEMKPIALVELQESFEKARPIVLNFAREFSSK